MTGTADGEGNIEYNICQTEKCPEGNEVGIARKEKSAEEKYVANEMATTVEKVRDETLRKTFHNFQSDV